MNYIPAFIIYLTVFRLSIITAGIVSIFLGYHLFCKGIWSEKSNEGTKVDVSIGRSKFSLVNAAPGTCFALFGVIIISATAVTGNPEVTLEQIRSSSPHIPSARSDNQDMKTVVRMRGDGDADSDTLVAVVQRGITFEKKGQSVAAMAEYRKAVNMMAEPMNLLAWQYHNRGESDKALPLARMAVQLSPENSNFSDTLAEILFKNKKYKEALKIMEKAVFLDPTLRRKLDRFRSAAQ